MSEVGARLLETGEAEVVGGGAHAEALELRKDEPHPVAGLLSGGELLQHARVAARLGVNEAREVVGVAHEAP